jgi:hypothetical protein
MKTLRAPDRLAEVNRRITDADERLAELQELVTRGRHTVLTVMLIQATTLTLCMLRETRARLEKRSPSRLN